MSDTESSESHRSIIGLAGGTGVRKCAYQGRTHLIVPVVAIIGDRVIQASNAPNPELVPATVVGATPGGWNNRPVVPFHPQVGDGSANTKEILEGYCFGMLLNTRFESGALQTEAWLDLSRIDTVGELAQSVVARCQAGELVSVSIGAYVRVDDAAIGTHDNQPYKGVWLSLVPDHLAMLPEDTPGACSIEMGCGGPRALSGESRLVVDTRRLLEEMSSMSKIKKATVSTVSTLRDKLTGLVSSIRSMVDTPTEAASEEAAELVGYSAMKTLLDQVATSLSAAQVAVNNLISDETDDPTETAADEDAEEEVETARLEAIQILCMSMYSNLSAVMSAAWALLDAKDDDSDDMNSMGDAGRYSAGKRNSTKDSETIQKVHDHSVVLGAMCSSDNSDSKTKGASASCGCHNKQGESMNKTQKDAIINRLVAAAACPFDDADKVMLAGLPDAKLEALGKQYPESGSAKVESATAGNDPVDSKSAASTPTVPTLSITEQLASMSAAEREKVLPADMIEILTRYRRAEEATRAQLISGLVAAQKEFTAEELGLESTEKLQKLARTVKVVVATAPADYSGMPFVNAPADNVTQAAAVNIDGPWTTSIKALKDKVRPTETAN